MAETAMTAERAIEITDRGLPSTFVPGRNLVFLTYAAAPGRPARTSEVLVGGMCETDFSAIPDCRRATIDAMETALNLGMAQDFRIETPLMALTKAETWALAKALGGEALVAITSRRATPATSANAGRCTPGATAAGLPGLRAAPARASTRLGRARTASGARERMRAMRSRRSS
jgi:7-cyano-7-deazaguanine synthase